MPARAAGIAVASFPAQARLRRAGRRREQIPGDSTDELQGPVHEGGELVRKRQEISDRDDRRQRQIPVSHGPLPPRDDKAGIVPARGYTPAYAVAETAMKSGTIPVRLFFRLGGEIKRVTLGFSELGRLFRLGVGDVFGEHRDHAGAFLVRGHHHAVGLALVHAEDGLEHLHHKFARRVVVVEQNHLPQLRPFGLRLQLRTRSEDGLAWAHRACSAARSYNAAPAGTAGRSAASHQRMRRPIRPIRQPCCFTRRAAALLCLKRGWGPLSKSREAPWNYATSAMPRASRARDRRSSARNAASDSPFPNGRNISRAAASAIFGVARPATTPSRPPSTMPPLERPNDRARSRSGA